MIGNLKAVLSEEISHEQSRPRYVLVNQINGETVDDGGGYGYSSAPHAYRAYAYKHRNRAKDAEKRIKQKEALFWMRQNPDFVRRLNEISKLEKVNAASIRGLVKNCQIKDFPFTAGEFSQIWKHL